MYFQVRDRAQDYYSSRNIYVVGTVQRLGLLLLQVYKGTADRVKDYYYSIYIYSTWYRVKDYYYSRYIYSTWYRVQDYYYVSRYWIESAWLCSHPPLFSCLQLWLWLFLEFLFSEEKTFIFFIIGQNNGYKIKFKMIIISRTN